MVSGAWCVAADQFGRPACSLFCQKVETTTQKEMEFFKNFNPKIGICGLSRMIAVASLIDYSPSQVAKGW